MKNQPSTNILKSSTANTRYDEDSKLVNLLKVRLEELTNKLTINEQQFGYTLDTMIEGVQMLDFNWNLIYANNAAIKYGPYPKEEVIGFSILEKYKGIEETEVFRQMALSMDDRKIRNMQTEYKFADGSGGFYELTIQPIPEGLLVLSVNVTDKIHAENLLKSSLKELTEYKFALDESSIVAITDQKGIIKHVNDNFCNISKYSREELIGQDHKIINSGYHPKEYIKSIWQTIAKGNIWKGELKNMAKDGSYYWVDTTIVPFLSECGKPHQYLAIRSDISERKLAEEKVIKTNRLYHFLSNINKSIVRVNDEQVLFDQVCSIATEIGEFKLAWISLLDDKSILQFRSLKGDLDAAHKILQMSGFDYTDPCLAHIPTTRVMKSGMYSVNNNIVDDPSFGPLAEEFKKYGLYSSMSVPIRKFGKIVGIFGFMAGAKDFFDSPEIALLEEATEDISFAIESIEKAKVHKETEELLESNERRFRALIEKSTDMKTLTTEKGNFIYGSPNIQAVFGYLPEEFIGKSAYDLFHPDEIEGFLERRKQISDKPGKFIDFQYRFKHKDGHWLWCEGTLTNMLDDPGIKAYVTNFKDITEKKIAEQEKEFEKNNTHALINNTTALMWSVDKDFNLITSNIPFEEMSKGIFGKVIAKGENVLEVSFNEEMFNHFKSSYERALQGEGFTEMMHFTQPSENWSEISYNPIRKGNEIIGVACYSRDITEIKTTEERLLKSEASLKEAQTIANVGNWELDFATDEAIWSEEACKIFGLPPDEKKQSQENWTSLIHPDDVEEVNKIIEEAFETLNDVTMTHRIVLRDGSIKHVYSKSKFVLDKNNKPTGMYGITQDITETKLAEAEREKMVEDIVLKNKNSEQFSYIVSHNLRAPIANILGLSNLLKGNISSDDKERSQQYLFKAVEQLDVVIKDLHEVLQIRNTMSESKKLVHLPELVEDIKISIANLVDKEHVKLLTDFSAAEEILVLKSYIHSVFYNLISNAIKYKRADVTPVISIRTEIHGKHIRIYFKDNGTGIDLKQHGEKLFGLYKRFHQNVEGKGMGLFMVKNQVEVLGGTISVSSEPGSGTEFIVELPV
ncbi:MAG TPA: PAS domain S-box protein [Bacteroidia bacterium]